MQNSEGKIKQNVFFFHIVIYTAPLYKVIYLNCSENRHNVIILTVLIKSKYFQIMFSYIKIVQGSGGET
jgi:hypothetical protein